MHKAIICTTALLLGLISGSLVATLFFTSSTPATTILTTYTTPACGTVGQPDCTVPSPTPPVPVVNTPAEPSPTVVINFDTAHTFTLAETVTYPDGLVVTLTTINDSRCKPDVQCIWAGELSPQFTFTGGDFTDTISQLSLGTSRMEPQTIGAYTVTLETATENTATIRITKDNPTSPISKTTIPKQTVAGAQVTKPTTPVPLAATPQPTTLQTDSAFGVEVTALITEATKKLRQRESLPIYQSDSDLAASAQKYSGRLLSGNYLAHIDRNGCDLTCRFDESGYAASSWGENLAMMEYDDRPTAEYVANFFMTQWQKSAGHRKNILSPTFTHQGVGVSVENGKVYVVVHFALPL
ncbi:CAP domain-containing protein [Patescibacteria group bacterium]|nr:CAP domain-containing protein [Patescibacteria group bacterium]